MHVCMHPARQSSMCASTSPPSPTHPLIHPSIHPLNHLCESVFHQCEVTVANTGDNQLRKRRVLFELTVLEVLVHDPLMLLLWACSCTLRSRVGAQLLTLYLWNEKENQDSIVPLKEHPHWKLLAKSHLLKVLPNRDQTFNAWGTILDPNYSSTLLSPVHLPTPGIVDSLALLSKHYHQSSMPQLLIPRHGVCPVKARYSP